METEDKILWVIFITLLVACIVATVGTLSGCQLRPKVDITSGPEIDIIPDTPREALIRTVYKTNWIITLGIIGAAISIAAIVNGSRAAFGPFIGCMAAVIMDLMIIRYATWLAFIGLGFAVVLLGYVIFVNRRAFKEVVITSEIAKSRLGSTDIARIFTDKGSIANNWQSPTTKKLVDKIQKEL